MDKELDFSADASIDASSDYFSELLDAAKPLQAVAAIDYWRQASDQYPQDARPALMLAAEYASLNRFQEAESTYITALALAPDMTVARFQLGLLQFAMGNPSGAFVTWAPLDTLEEENPLRLFKTAFEFLALEQFSQAQEWLERCIVRNKNNPALTRDAQYVLDEIAERLSGQQSDVDEDLFDNRFPPSSTRYLH